MLIYFYFSLSLSFSLPLFPSLSHPFPKDKRIDEFHTLGKFSGHEEKQVRRWAPLVVILTWTAILTALLLWLFIPSVLAGETTPIFVLSATIIFGACEIEIEG